MMYYPIVEIKMILIQPDYRDINAAINIKNFALVEREEGLGDSFPKGKGMNQEAPML
jgi:hypothetical protein